MSGPASGPQSQIIDDSKKVIDESERNSYLAIVQKINTIGLEPQVPATGKMPGIRVREEDVTMEILEPPTKRARVEQEVCVSHRSTRVLTSRFTAVFKTVNL